MVATCRRADSAWEWVKSSTFSTAKVALAVSATCQTTMAPMLMGLPLRSLTLMVLVSKLRTLMLTLVGLLSGGMARSPVWRMVPM